jgi:hypothetical protein
LVPARMSSPTATRWSLIQQAGKDPEYTSLTETHGIRRVTLTWLEVKPTGKPLDRHA